MPFSGLIRPAGRPPSGQTVCVGPSRADADGPDWLLVWGKLPRHPVATGRNPVTVALLEAVDLGRPLALYYHGGTQPARLRRFSPDLVFRAQGVRHAYVSGYCHLRHAPRILRVDRILAGVRESRTGLKLHNELKRLRAGLKVPKDAAGRRR